MSEARTIDCPHCHATPTNCDLRLIASSPDLGVVEIFHTKDCVDYEPEQPADGTAT